MEENNKVIVFEKKEIVLVLLFVVILIITSFTLGIRLGKKLGFADSGITAADEATVTLKSGAEEDAEITVKEDSQLTDEDKLRKLMDEQQNLLKNNLEKVTSETPETSVAKKSLENKTPNSMLGKFTIQLGSYPSIDEAKQFAEGFSVRGYSPIINETQLENKGTWYRVSLGLFSTVDEAKAYIKNEQSLFSGQDYVITEIK